MEQLNHYLAKSNPPKTIREHTDDVLAALHTLRQYGYITDKHLLYLCERAAEYHDYGKVNADFQLRIKSNIRLIGNSEIYHNVLSAPFVRKSDFENDIDYAIVLNAVLNHHHYGLQANIEALSSRTDEIVEKLTGFNIEKIKKRMLSVIIPEIIGSREAILVQGALLKCDYAASAGIDIEYQNDFLDNSLDDVFSHYKINDLQQFCKDNSNDNLIVTAPTGMGKTEASLLWLSNNKGFYVLPLRTAINSMYYRIKDNIVKKDTDTKVALLHSDTLSVRLQGNSGSELEIFDYMNLCKRFSMPITVCTPDQIFDFVFKYPGYELKLATLSYSKVIIDEIQAYNSELLAYLIYGIHEIVRMGGSFSIFTATLPPYILTLLNKSNHVINYKTADFSDANNQLRHNLCVIDEEITAEYVSTKFLENDTGASSKTLVVCNTVKKAQELYEKLSAIYGVETVKLLHSKFTRVDRSLKEIDILEDGKTETSKRVIWVATQIVEASLDIDFDFLFTELSELTGLFQRLGRCNRKGLKSVDNTNCYIFTKIPQNLLVSRYDTSRGFIDETLHNLSKDQLQGFSGIITEEQKKNMIDTAFTYNNIKDSAFIKEYRGKYNFLTSLYLGDMTNKDVDKRFRRIVSHQIIPVEIYKNHQAEIDEAAAVVGAEYDATIPKSQNYINKQKAKIAIEKFCVSVSDWDIRKVTLIKTIATSKYEEIKVVDCFYNSRVGFKKKVDCLPPVTQKAGEVDKDSDDQQSSRFL